MLKQQLPDTQYVFLKSTQYTLVVRLLAASVIYVLVRILFNDFLPKFIPNTLFVLFILVSIVDLIATHLIGIYSRLQRYVSPKSEAAQTGFNKVNAFLERLNTDKELPQEPQLKRVNDLLTLLNSNRTVREPQEYIAPYKIRTYVQRSYGSETIPMEEFVTLRGGVKDVTSCIAKTKVWIQHVVLSSIVQEMDRLAQFEAQLETMRFGLHRDEGLEREVLFLRKKLRFVFGESQERISIIRKLSSTLETMDLDVEKSGVFYVSEILMNILVRVIAFGASCTDPEYELSSLYSPLDTSREPSDGSIWHYERNPPRFYLVDNDRRVATEGRYENSVATVFLFLLRIVRVRNGVVGQLSLKKKSMELDFVVNS